MTKDIKFELIIKEIFVGLACGLVGVLIFSLFDPWDLYYSVMFGSIAGYLSMWTGIGVVGYLTLKKLGRQNEFTESIGLSFLGLIAAVGLYAILVSLTFKIHPYFISSFIMPIVLPLTGAILGFNYRLRKPTINKDSGASEIDSASRTN
jgi:hypothetical protein